MKVPLILDLSSVNGVQRLKFWRDGNYEFVVPPIRPFCYTEQEPPNNAFVELVEKRLLYDIYNPKKLFKCSFNTVKEMRDTCGASPDFFESRFNFKDRIYTSCPQLIRLYANDRPLKIMCLDFEMDTFMKFPIPQENAIIAAGMQFFTYGAKEPDKIELILADTYNNDKPLLEAVLQRIEEEDPDIFVVYNGLGFDFPYMFDRLKINKLDVKRLSRDNSEPWINNSAKRKEIKLGGRIIYDIFYRSVERDQNLFKWSPPNKQMKTVAKIYGLDNVVEEPQSVMGNMRSMVGNPELEKYLTSDIRCTKFLGDIYLPSIINLAESRGVSLESCINSSPSYIGHMLFAKQYEQMGIISDKSVGEAYPDLIKDKQGAIVDCFKPGLYKKGLKKKDVISFYPNLVRTFNLSPETCFLMSTENGTRPYTARMNHEAKFLTLEIPDEKLNKQLIIGIDFSQRGFASEFVDQAMTERIQMKKMMKILDEKSPEYADLDVNQLGLKVTLNTITGYYGQEYSMFGSLACYSAITGTGRFLISKLIEYVGGAIALDTDGIVTDDLISIEDTNAWLEKFILDFFQVPKNYIELELENFEAAYFRDKSKQYLLLERNKKGEPHLVVHGISFKGSSLPKLFSKIIYTMGLKMLLLDDNDPIANKEFDDEIAACYDQSNWILDHIAKRIKCQPLSNYKTSGTLGGQLVKQYESRFKTKIKTDTQLSYVKVKQKGSTYRLMTIFDNLEDVSNLDKDYYLDIIESAFERLGLTDRTPKGKAAIKEAKKQKTLFDFGATA